MADYGTHWVYEPHLGMSRYGEDTTPGKASSAVASVGRAAGSIASVGKAHSSVASVGDAESDVSP